MKRTREESSPSGTDKEDVTTAVETGDGKDPAEGSAVEGRTRSDAATDGPPPTKIAATGEAAPPQESGKDGGGGAAAAAASTAPAKSSAGSSSNRAGVAAATTAAKAATAKGAGAGAAGAEEVVEPPPDVEGIPNETLFVGNLSYRVSEAVIIKLFTPFGKVVREQFCYHMVGPRRGEPRGFCFVEYSNTQDAAKAIRALHGRKLYGRPLRVRFMTVEGKGRMDYSTTDKTATSGSFATSGGDGGARIPPPAGAAGEAGVGPGVSKLSLDKKVALLKQKLREAQQSGKR